MTRLDPPSRRARSICTALLVVALLLLGVSVVAQAQQVDPPQASLQDPPDLLIFHTGEVRGALAPGG